MFEYKEHVIQFIVTCGFIPYYLILSNLAPSSKQIILANDVSLSYPNVDSRIEIWLLTVLTICIPSLFAILNICKVLYDNKDAPVDDPVRKTVLMTFWHIIGISQTLLISGSICYNIRILTGIPAPNYFAACAYPETCTDSVVSSFPSLHSTLAFSSLVYTFFLMRDLLKLDKNQDKNKNSWYSVSSITCFTSIYLAAWISITRIQDYKENVVSVLTGIVIGTVIAIVTKQNTEYYMTKEVRKEINLQLTQSNVMSTLTSKMEARLQNIV